MKLFKNFLKICLIIIVSMSCLNFYSTYAKSDELEIKILDYTDEYKKWLKLPEEERNEIIPPRMYDIPTETASNKKFLFKSSNSSYFNLQDFIPENVKVRDQKQTNACWVFSMVGALESTLGLYDYTEGNPKVSYDYSERHMEFATSREFLNGEINTQGYNREVAKGGNPNLGFAYLTNGMGAIDESEMPFKNSISKIALSEIQNKTVTSKVTDTIDIPSNYNNSLTDRIEASRQIKEQVSTNGGVIVAIHGAQINSEYFNSTTGAIYCDDEDNCPPNHQVLIIGWDDNYAISNFNSAHRPSTKGAWIIKNSWGTGYGKNGIMYLSYEDVNVYYWLAGIQKASSIVDYDNIYQYNEFGYNMFGQVNQTKIYLANIYEKKSNKKEYITEVQLYAPQTYTCKVYVNPNGSSKAKSNLTQVQLKAGSSETFGVGYHTLEFAEPLEIKGDSFVVAVEIQSTGSQVKYAIENNQGAEVMQYAVTNSGKCFITNDNGLLNNQWTDLSNAAACGIASDSTIKAFTKFESELPKGDVNGDGAVTLVDYGMVLSHVKNKTKLEGDKLLRADVNGDKKVTLIDYGMILSHVKRKQLLQ